MVLSPDFLDEFTPTPTKNLSGRKNSWVKYSFRPASALPSNPVRFEKRDSDAGRAVYCLRRLKNRCVATVAMVREKLVPAIPGTLVTLFQFVAVMETADSNSQPTALVVQEIVAGSGSVGLMLIRCRT